jgi:hypothetical protein
MTSTHVNALLATVASIGLALGARLAVWPLVPVDAPRRADAAVGPESMATSVKPDSLVAQLVVRDPFRFTRRPSPVRYDPVRLAQPATPPSPKPPLVLLGIVWDRRSDATALVEGIPGAEGPRLVRLGETVGGLRVKAIKPDRLVITGLDTTWTLTVREPWR